MAGQLIPISMDLNRMLFCNKQLNLLSPRLPPTTSFEIMLCRERRSWTAKEDQLLRDAVEREDPNNPNPSKWHAIAKHVPNRTNKDCRKRWFAKMASDVVKGGWAPDEDEKLVKGIEKYGTRWSLVASVVGTRNSDQCAKRWTDTLNPAIDRTTWTAEADELLLQAVNEHGKVWTKIVKTYFPGRTGLSAKNRYNSITRFNNVDHSRGSRSRRRTPEVLPYLSHRKAESVSSSSSSVSPSTPSISIPEGSHSPFSSAIDSVSESYLFDTLSGWSQSSSPSEATSEGMYVYSSPNMFGVKEESLVSGSLLSLPPPINSSHQAFDSCLNSTITSFADDSHLVYNGSRSASQAAPREGLYTIIPNELYPSYPQQYPAGYPPSNESANQMSLFDALPAPGNTQIGMNWSAGNFEAIRHGRPKMLSTSFVF
ncbi:putative myb-like DNA-binding domain containing protein [Lyophyllum shimeji]|uniref:Myb-like DNA-binding domain containing protein n=1 Tax=Lyophyllum shimeji TaxID=47721 RepID=A0A9P3PSG4_LYOSH|nr:putative myb-like DNA-binding domain containing protein [Lyophyllum shimeji]